MFRAANLLVYFSFNSLSCLFLQEVTSLSQKCHSNSACHSLPLPSTTHLSLKLSEDKALPSLQDETKIKRNAHLSIPERHLCHCCRNANYHTLVIQYLIRFSVCRRSCHPSSGSCWRLQRRPRWWLRRWPRWRWWRGLRRGSILRRRARQGMSMS